MGLSCGDGDYDGADWWWLWNRGDTKPLSTKRSRKCCSCGTKIKVGDLAMPIQRIRNPNTEIEERICGDEVYMANWYLCDTCNDLAISLDELGFCFSLGDESIKEQIADYRRSEEAWAKRHAPVDNLPSTESHTK